MASLLSIKTIPEWYHTHTCPASAGWGLARLLLGQCPHCSWAPASPSRSSRPPCPDLFSLPSLLFLKNRVLMSPYFPWLPSLSLPPSLPLSLSFFFLFPSLRKIKTKSVNTQKIFASTTHHSSAVPSPPTFTCHTHKPKSLHAQKSPAVMKGAAQRYFVTCLWAALLHINEHTSPCFSWNFIPLEVTVFCSVFPS